MTEFEVNSDELIVDCLADDLLSTKIVIFLFLKAAHHIIAIGLGEGKSLEQMNCAHCQN